MKNNAAPFSLGLLLASGLAAIALPVGAQIPPPADAEGILAPAYTGKSYSPYAGRAFASLPLWGDSHVHANISMDAGLFGNRLGLDEAYRFARGEQIVSSNGTLVKLSRPLDWLAVADHTDGMGFFPDLRAGKPHILAEPLGKDWYERIYAGDGAAVAMELIGLFSQDQIPEALIYSPDSAPYKSTWKRIVEAAEAYNESGRFTAVIGYEWTSLIAGNNMHRVVLYRDGAAKASQMVPYSMTPPMGSPNPRDLWQWLTTY